MRAIAAVRSRSRIQLLALIGALALGVALIAGYGTVEGAIAGGNDPSDRASGPDTQAAFSILDRNSPISGDGVLTSWTIFAREIAVDPDQAQVKLKIYRDTGSDFQVVGESAFVTPDLIAGAQTFALATPIPVLAGDFVGMRVDAQGIVPYEVPAGCTEFATDLTHTTLFNTAAADAAPGAVETFDSSGDRVYSISVAGESLTVALTPSFETNTFGEMHTVTATVTTDLGAAVVGVEVRFLVMSPGPNSGDSGDDTSDASGDTTFTYTGDGGVGTDTITAWVDLDGDGVIDDGEPQDLAVKIWVAAAVTSVTLSPSSDTNPIGTSLTLTATLSPVTNGALVRFEITDGPHAGATGLNTTNSSSQAFFTYLGSTTGTDIVFAWFDQDNDSVRDAGEPQAVALKTWTSTGVTSITLEPASDTNPIGSTHTVTATVSPTTVGAVVRFRVASGPNAGATGVDTTNANSRATFSYSNAVVGLDVIEAWVDTNNDGVRDAGEAQTAVLKTWVASGAVSAIALAPPADTNFVGSSHTVTATVTPQITGVLVRFDVISGPNIVKTGADVTDAAGQATFSYTGSVFGNDVILAWGDLDGDGQPDSNEPQAIATKERVAQPGLDGVTQDVDEKVTICHFPPVNPGNAHTLTIGAPAVATHLAEHGDTLGACTAVVTVSSQQQRGGSSSSANVNQGSVAQLAHRLRAECSGEAELSQSSVGALKSALAADGVDLAVIDALLDAGNCAQIALDLDVRGPGQGGGRPASAGKPS